MEVFIDKINELINYGWGCEEQNYYLQWLFRVDQVLTVGFSEEVARDFMSLKSDYTEDWESSIPTQIGYLEGIVLKLSCESVSNQKNEYEASKSLALSSRKTNKVFIVHGHESSTKESVARYIEKIGLDPIILHEQPNGGKTIIEKFEIYSDVGFAVILLTPDDVGSAKDNKDDLKVRARQNVIMELGYFLGKLGRERVCALYKEGVEIPSDYQGVLYTEYDASEGWKIKLAQELNECGFALNIEAIISK